MRPVNEILESFLDGIDIAPGAQEQGAPWLGDPWYFDVRCTNCCHEYPNSMSCCPACDHDEVMPVGE